MEKAKIMNQYNEVPYLNWDTIYRKVTKPQGNITQMVSPFPAGDHKAARNRQDSRRMAENGFAPPP